MNLYVSRCCWAKNFAIHALRPPIKKTIELQKSKTVPPPRTLIFHMWSKDEKKIIKKRLNPRMFGDLVAFHSLYIYIYILSTYQQWDNNSSRCWEGLSFFWIMVIRIRIEKKTFFPSKMLKKHNPRNHGRCRGWNHMSGIIDWRCCMWTGEGIICKFIICRFPRETSGFPWVEPPDLGLEPTKKGW